MWLQLYSRSNSRSEAVENGQFKLRLCATIDHSFFSVCFSASAILSSSIFRNQRFNRITNKFVYHSCHLSARERSLTNSSRISPKRMNHRYKRISKFICHMLNCNSSKKFTLKASDVSRVLTLCIVPPNRINPWLLLSCANRLPDDDQQRYEPLKQNC